MSDALGATRRNAALFHHGPGKRRVRAESVAVGPVPNYMPDDAIVLGSVHALDIVDDGGTPIGDAVAWPDEPRPLLGLDVMSGTLFVVGYYSRLRGQRFGNAGELKALDLAPEWVPNATPITGRLGSITYGAPETGVAAIDYSPRFEDGRPYRHDFGPTARPYVLNDSPKGVLLFAGWGLYDVTERGIVDWSEREPLERSLTLCGEAA